MIKDVKNIIKRLFGLYKENSHIILKIFGLRMSFKNGFINPLEDCCCIPNLEYFRSQGTVFLHPIGITIHPGTIVGKGCWIYQNVTIGCDQKHPDNVPELGNHVTVFANAVIFGKIKIGDNATIGAGAVVFKDVPANATVVGNPARIIEKKDNE